MVEDCDFLENSAGEKGGALHVTEPSAVRTAVQLKRGKLEGNVALDGGAIAMDLKVCCRVDKFLYVGGAEQEVRWQLCSRAAYGWVRSSTKFVSIYLQWLS